MGHKQTLVLLILTTTVLILLPLLVKNLGTTTIPTNGNYSDGAQSPLPSLSPNTHTNNVFCANDTNHIYNYPRTFTRKCVATHDTQKTGTDSTKDDTDSTNTKDELCDTANHDTNSNEKSMDKSDCRYTTNTDTDHYENVPNYWKKTAQIKIHTLDDTAENDAKANEDCTDKPAHYGILGKFDDSACPPNYWIKATQIAICPCALDDTLDDIIKKTEPAKMTIIKAQNLQIMLKIGPMPTHKNDSVLICLQNCLCIFIFVFPNLTSVQNQLHKYFM